MLWRLKISAVVLTLAAVAPAFAADAVDNRVALRRSREEMAANPVATARAVQPAPMVVYRQTQNETARVAPAQPAQEMPSFVGVGGSRTVSADRTEATPARQAVYQTLSTRGPRTAAAVSETTVTQVQPVQVEPAQPATLASHSRVSVGVGYSSGYHGGSSVGVRVGYSSGYHGGTRVGVAYSSGYRGYYGGGYYGGGYGYGCAPAYYYRPAYYCPSPVYYPGPCYSYPRYYSYGGYCGPSYGFSFGFRGRW